MSRMCACVFKNDCGCVVLLTFQPLWKRPMVFSRYQFVCFANRSHGHCSLRPGGRVAVGATPTTDGLCCSGTLRSGQRASDLLRRGLPQRRSEVGPGRLPAGPEEASGKGKPQGLGQLGSQALEMLEIPSLLSCFNSKNLLSFSLNVPFQGSPGLLSWTRCLFPLECGTGCL